MSSTELRLTGFDNWNKSWTLCKDPHKMVPVKTYFPNTQNQNALGFIEYLERTNRVCSQTFALFIPVNVISFSDVVLPWTVHYALQSDKKDFYRYVDVGSSLLIDLVTLPFRLIVLVPRVIYKCTQQPASKLSHPICETKTTGDDKESPVLVEYKDKKFYFSSSFMHEIQAHRHFAQGKAAAQSVILYRVSYSEKTEKIDDELEDMPISEPQGFRHSKSVSEVPIHQKVLALGAIGSALAHKIDVLKCKGRHAQTIKLVGSVFGIAIIGAALKKFFSHHPESVSSPLSSRRTWGTDEDPLGEKGKDKARLYKIFGISPLSHTCPSFRFNIACYPDTPVETLRQAFATEAEVPMNQIALHDIDGKHFEDGKTLQDYTIKEGRIRWYKRLKPPSQ